MFTCTSLWFVCSKAAVKSSNKVVCGYGDVIVITLLPGNFFDPPTHWEITNINCEHTTDGIKFKCL